MMSPMQLVAWRDDLADNLRSWQEPEGILCGSEPDLAEREACRERLRIAIEVIGRILVG
jgi:hypothetical protein